MFTGIIEELGTVRAIDLGDDHAELTITGPLVVSDATPGVSIAVNGVCLTVVEADAETFRVDVMKETLDRSSLGTLETGARVNLERAMPANGRFGGHIVQGHVDATATILSRQPGTKWDLVTIALPGAIARYVVEKGSITVDGVSLTVAAITEAAFSIGLIPTTLELTTLGHKGVGEPVNLEVDVLAKYVERLVAR